MLVVSGRIQSRSTSVLYLGTRFQSPTDDIEIMARSGGDLFKLPEVEHFLFVIRMFWIRSAIWMTCILRYITSNAGSWFLCATACAKSGATNSSSARWRPSGPRATTLRTWYGCLPHFGQIQAQCSGPRFRPLAGTRTWPAGTVGSAAARNPTDLQEDQGVAEDRLPGRGSQDGLSRNGHSGSAQPAVRMSTNVSYEQQLPTVCSLCL